MHTFYQLGKKLCISPPFFIPFQSFFFPQPDIWPVGGGGQTEKYTPLQTYPNVRNDNTNIGTKIVTDIERIKYPSPMKLKELISRQELVQRSKLLYNLFAKVDS